MVQKNRIASGYIRSFTFGVEDSLASTVGLLSGIASADVPAKTVVLTGLVLIFTEAMSMGIGNFLSEQSVEEYSRHRELSMKNSIPSALIMFFSYLISGVIPIIPYMLFPHPYALIISVASALLSLGLLGAINARLSKTRSLPQVARMMILGGCVAIVGVVIGTVFNR